MKKSGNALRLLLVLFIMLTGCGGQDDVNIISSLDGSEVIESSGNASESSTSVSEKETSVSEAGNDGNIDGILLVSAGEQWNTWQLKIPAYIYLEEPKEIFTVQVSLPSHWEPKADVDESISYHFPFAIGFVEEKDKPEELIKIDFFMVSDERENSKWIASSDKLEHIKNGFPPYLDKPIINNTISIEYMDIHETRWLIRECFYMSYDVEFKDEGMRFCRLYTAYEDCYEIGFSVDIRDGKLENDDTKELLKTILESWKVLSVEPIDG